MSAAGLADPARLFVGIGLGDAARAQVAALLARVRALVATPDWKARVPADADAHVTLRFLGAVPRSRLSALESALAEALAGAREADVSYGPIEVLLKHAWLRVGAGASYLAELAAHVERACVAARVAAPDDEPTHAFRPHVTLVRIDREPDGGRDALLSLEPGVLGAERVSELTLFESLARAHAGAAHYASLARFPLRAQVVDAHGVVR